MSFRLGGQDGVAVEAAKWQRVLTERHFATYAVAGGGAPDVVVPGLAMDAPSPPSDADLRAALSPADLVVVENLCSLPLNPGAMACAARVLAGRPAILHHHDLPWQRPAFKGHPPPPSDPAWRHVTINRRSCEELRIRGIEAECIYNAFDTSASSGDRAATRAVMDVADGDILVLQPTRAIARKNVPGAVAIAEALGATYWLLGPAEDDYDHELANIIASARCRVLRGFAPERRHSVADAYAASDVVAFPSTWEGFGNPAIESAVYGKPLAIGDYPVAAELAAFGFQWFDARDVHALSAWLAAPDARLLAHNERVAREHFSLERLAQQLDDLITGHLALARAAAARNDHSA